MNPLKLISAGLVVLLAGCEKKQVALETPPVGKSMEPRKVTLEEFKAVIKEKREALALARGKEWPTRGAVFQPAAPTYYEAIKDFTNLHGFVGGLGQEYATLTGCEVMVSASVAMRPLKIVATSDSREAKLQAFDRALSDAGVAIKRVDKATLVLMSAP